MKTNYQLSIYVVPEFIDINKIIYGIRLIYRSIHKVSHILFQFRRTDNFLDWPYLNSLWCNHSLPWSRSDVTLRLITQLLYINDDLLTVTEAKKIIEYVEDNIESTSTFKHISVIMTHSIDNSTNIYNINKTKI